MEKTRDLSFDFLKGWLIILVITGHILPGSADEGVRGLIYYFHMPLFLAITGYFIKDKNLKQTFGTLLTKYNKRLLTPYIIAFLVYTCSYLYFSIGMNQLHIRHIIGSVIYPFYHLWYIPAVLLFVFYTKIINKNKALIIFAFVVASVVSIVWYAYGDHLNNSFPLIKYMGDKRFYYYYSFFLMGYILGRNTIQIKTEISLISCITIPLLNYFFVLPPLLNAILWYLFNIFLINLTVNTCHKLAIINSNIVIRLGQTSLPVYLWHVAVISVVTAFIDSDKPIYYVVVTTLIIALSLLFIFAHKKNKILNIFFYGEITQGKQKNS
jgi:fucose 4-O-acetylase-like acetyltransferase